MHTPPSPITNFSYIAELFRDLRARNLFKSPRDIALLFSTDGVQIFKRRARFETWPLLVQILNLPPTERIKDENYMMLGTIPGSKAPKDIDSFLWPFLQELDTLHAGVLAYNASTGEDFILHGYLTLITADMPARYKLMGSRSKGSYPYCPYCNILGIRAFGYCYCPFTIPTDMPNLPTPIANSTQRTPHKPDPLKNPPVFPPTGFNPKALPLRTHKEWVEDGRHIVLTNDLNYSKHCGINNLSCFHRLRSSSVLYPRSFPVDIMHAFFKGIIPHMYDHFRGRFIFNSTPPPADRGRPPIPRTNQTTNQEPALPTSDDDASVAGVTDPDIDFEPNESEKETEGSQPPSTQGAPSRRRRRVPKSTGNPKSQAKTVVALAKIHRRKNRPRTHKQKFVACPQDPWNIAPENWSDIGRDMRKSSKSFPPCMGDGIRDIVEHSGDFKAAEWKVWTTILSPIYLKRFLPPNLYDGYMLLVDAINLCCEYSLSASDLSKIENLMCDFLNHYEQEYYQYRYDRLPAMKPTMHQLAHIIHSIKCAGPPRTFWQFSMERQCGVLAKSVRSRAGANANMANLILTRELLKYLPYTTRSNTLNPSEYPDVGSKRQPLYKRLLALLKQTRINDAEKSYADVPPLPAPSRIKGKVIHKLNGHERRAIDIYLRHAGLSYPQPLLKSENKIHQWKMFRLPNGHKIYGSATHNEDDC